jgi:hypothetical protein
MLALYEFENGVLGERIWQESANAKGKNEAREK